MNGHVQAGIALFYAMVIVGLIVAKIAGHIAWAWWLVLLPLWGPVALIVVIAILAIAGFADASRRGENPFQ